MLEKLRVIGRAFLAAVTSPEAVKLERGVAALVVFRVLLALGATLELAELLKRFVGG